MAQKKRTSVSKPESRGKLLEMRKPPAPAPSPDRDQVPSQLDQELAQLSAHAPTLGARVEQEISKSSDSQLDWAGRMLAIQSIHGVELQNEAAAELRLPDVATSALVEPTPGDAADTE